MSAKTVKFPVLPADRLFEGGIDFELPRIVPLAQEFTRQRVVEIESVIRRRMEQSGISDRLFSGARIAVAVGSRGITNIAEIVKYLISWLREKGTNPYIVPAMGSHGGPSPRGQAEVLAGYGITEQTMGVPVISSLDTVELGKTGDGLPVWFDAAAFSADGIIPVNRVKPHTDFSGEIESGLLKMLSIGLGKHRGASFIHSRGFPVLGRTILDAAGVILDKAPVLGGLAIIENAYKETAEIEYVSLKEMEEREKKLLLRARALMPRLPVQNMDFLLVQYVGKDISGAGFDPNITGRRKIWGVSDLQQPRVSVMAVLDLSEDTRGNAAGIGIADLVSFRAVEKIDIASTYTSLTACALPQQGHIPMVFATDLEIVKAGAKISRFAEPSEVRLCWIQDTSHLQKVWVSESLVQDALKRKEVKVIGQARNLPFNKCGRLEWLPPEVIF